MACPGCGGAFRKGTTVLLLLEQPRNARVCSSCARSGVLVVAPRVAPVIKAVAPRDDVVAEAIRQLRAYARASAVQQTTPDATAKHVAHFGGRQEGFEGAIALLQSLRKAGS